MSIPAHCGSCRRELLLDQLLQPSDGFRCPFCGFAFAPSYATIAPGLAARILDSHGALVRALAELQSMVHGRLELDRAAVYGLRPALAAGAKLVIEPGTSVALYAVPIAGLRVVRGHGGLVDGPLDEPGAREHALQLARERGYLGA